MILQHLIDLPIRIMNTPAPKFIKRARHHHGKWVAQTRPGGMLVGPVQSVASHSVSSSNPDPRSWLELSRDVERFARIRQLLCGVA